MTTKNGSGIHGLQPKGGLLGGGGGSTGGSGMIGSSARGRNRSVLRKAFGKTIHTASTAYLRSQNTNNKKHVASGSDYTRFKQLQTTNRSYNEFSFGGYTNSAYTNLSKAK